MDTKQIPSPDLPPDWNTLAQLTPQKVQSFIWDYISGKPLDQLAASFGLTFRQARDILAHPEVQAEIDAALELARARADHMIQVALTEAIDVLLTTIRDLEAPAETRRKAAGQIIRLHKDLHKRAAAPAATPSPIASHNPAPPAPHTSPPNPLAGISATPSQPTPIPRTRRERRAAQRHQPEPIAA
ncbi:MAG: hypothetical protein IBJ10_04080 [Phycisphaerales bacterium]|nr:hypothetical protein [Phycisphaerales bacterium]